MKKFLIAAVFVVAMLIAAGTAFMLRGESNRKQMVAYINDPEAARSAIIANPKDAVAHEALANYYIKNNDRLNSVKHLREVVRIAPSDRFAQYRLAGQLRFVGLKDEAIKMYQQLAQGDDRIAKSSQRLLSKLKQSP